MSNQSLRTTVFGSVLALCLFILSACGGPSEAEIQSTVEAAVRATMEAQIAATEQAAAEACGQVKLTQYADEVERQIERFVQQKFLVSSTPRVSMGEPMQRLLDLQDETRDIEIPECMKQYHEQVVSMMGMYRIAYQNFAAQGDELVTQAALEVGDKSLKEVQDGLPGIRKGEVLPAPSVSASPSS